MAAASECKVLVCLDGHDAEGEGASDVLKWLIDHQPDNQPRWHVDIFGHVHNDSSIPLAQKIGNALGVAVPKEKREAALRERVSRLEQELHDGRRQVPVATDVDASSRTMMQTYRAKTDAVRPSLVLLNQREDADALFQPLGSEVVRLQQSMEQHHNLSIIITKRRIPTAPFCMHYIVLVDPEFSLSSQRAVEGCGKLMSQLDGEGQDSIFVSFLSVWSLPDVATAMYSTDERWKEEKRKLEHQAHRAGTAAHQHLKSIVQRRFESTIHTSNDALCSKIDRLVRKVQDLGVACYHNVVVGGGRAVVDEKRGSFSSAVGLASRRVFGSTADKVLGGVKCGAVTITY